MLFALWLGVALAPGQSDQKFSGDPDAARLITSDIQNFWRAYDQARPNNQREVFEREYFKPASPGLRDFIKARIGSADLLVKTINAHPKYYASIRDSSLRVETMQARIKAAFYALKYLYPEAVFPDVYFVIGRMNSGGTTSERGLLIGLEMHCRTITTLETELSDWHKQVLKSIENLPDIVAHELIHFEQNYPSQVTVLSQCINEGSADFIGELISGGSINHHLHSWANPKERELWEEFRRDMDGGKISNWLYNASSVKNRPADLGYYMGYKITEAYYRQTNVKRQAIRDILTIKDFKKFLKDSGYENKFSSTDKPASQEKKS